MPVAGGLRPDRSVGVRQQPGIGDDQVVVEPARPDDPFENGDLWSDVLERKGGGYTLLARMPEDPTLN